MKKYITLLVWVGTFLVSNAQASLTNAVGIFAGVKNHNSSTHGLLGVEYMHHPSAFFDVSAFAEKELSADVLAFGVGIGIYPVPVFGLKIVAAPAIEMNTSADTSDFFVRAGLAYEISLVAMFIQPAFYLDFSHGSSSKIIGISAGVGF